MDYLNLGCGYHFHPDWTNVDFISTGPGVIAHDLRQGIPFPTASFDVVYHSHVLEHFSKIEAEQFLHECHRVLRPYGIIRIAVPDLEQITRLYLKALEEASKGSQEWAANYEWLMLEMYDQTVRNFSGGDMAAYLAKSDIPNLSFILERIGTEGETLVNILRQHRQSSASDPKPAYTNQKTDDLALQIGQFRLGGEVHQWMYDRYSLSLLLTKTGFTNVKVCTAHDSQIPEFSRFALDVEPNGRVRKPDSLFVEATESRPNLWRQYFPAKSTSSTTLKFALINTVDIGGGAARAAYRLHKGLLQTKQQSFMFVSNKISSDDTVCAVGEIHPVEEPRFSLFKVVQDHHINNNRTEQSNTLFSLPYPGLDLSQLDEIIEADIINLHWIAYCQSPETIRHLSTLGKPIIWTLHDMWAFTGGCHYSAGCTKYTSDCMNCPQLYDDPLNLPAVVLQDKITAFAGLNLTIVTPSTWLSRCAKQSKLFGNCRIEVIPNAIETHVFTPLDKRKAKQALNINPDTFTLLIGADDANEKRKGFHELSRSLQHCLEDPGFCELARRGKVQLLYFGLPNSQLSSLPLSVLPLGQITSDEQLCRIYSAADLFVLPSLEDNLPNTMLEAMSCGTPVLGFDIGGIPDLVKNDVTGWLVPVGNIAALSEAILKCATSPQWCERLSQSCRQIIETNCSLSNQAQQYIDLAWDLLGKTYQPISGTSTSHRFQDSKRLPIFTSGTNLIKVPIDSSCSSQAEAVLEKASLKVLTNELERYRIELERVQTQSQEQSVHEQTELKKARTRVKKLQVRLDETKIELQKLKEEVDAMKTSKFWKLRSLWFKIKSLVGLSID